MPTDRASTTAAPWRSRFWRRWVGANALAELIGLGTVAVAGFLVVTRMGESSDARHAWSLAAAMVGLGAIEGAVVGVAQRAVLRSRLPLLRGWVWCTVAGALVAWLLGMLPSTLASTHQGPDAPQPEISPWIVLLLAAALGAATGPLLALFQWLSLRRGVDRAWRWLPANAAAWAVGMPVIFLGAQIMHSSSSLALIGFVAALSLLLAGALVGAIHGWALLYLLPATAKESP